MTLTVLCCGLPYNTAWWVKNTGLLNVLSDYCCIVVHQSLCVLHRLLADNGQCKEHWTNRHNVSHVLWWEQDQNQTDIKIDYLALFHSISILKQISSKYTLENLTTVKNSQRGAYQLFWWQNSEKIAQVREFRKDVRSRCDAVTGVGCVKLCSFCSTVWQFEGNWKLEESISYQEVCSNNNGKLVEVRSRMFSCAKT